MLIEFVPSLAWFSGMIDFLNGLLAGTNSNLPLFLTYFITNGLNYRQSESPGCGPNLLSRMGESRRVSIG
jgi:hypothetical protein